MLDGFLRSWKSGGRQTVTWVEFDDYARRVFAGDPDDWSRNPVSFVAAMTQALGVIATDVISIDAFGPFRAAMGSTAPEDPVAFAKVIMEEDAPLAFVDDVVKALAHRYAGAKDLVLKLPVPRDVLLACGGAESDAGDFDNLDDVGMSLCNFLRRYAEKEIAGILLTVTESADFSEDEVEAYGPVFAAARHYGWFAGLATSGSYTDRLPEIDCDIFLFPEVPADRLQTSAPGPVGGGLCRAFWLGTENLSGGRSPFVFYGIIPADAEPEGVVERIGVLESV